MAKQLYTERLALAVPNVLFAQLLLRYFTRNKDHLEPWMPKLAHDFYSLDFQLQRMKAEILDTNRGAKWSMYLFHKNDTGFAKVIGYVSCSNIIRGPFQSGIVAYSMDNEETKKGLLTEGLGRFIQFLFEEVNLHRVEANIIPRNNPSIRVVEKLGFTREGYSKDYLEINGRWEDHLRYALLNDNWKAGPSGK